MRTKKILLTAALSAVTAASSMAQVYSINVVGYANSVWTNNAFSLVANPFDDLNGNWLTNIGATLPAGSQILIWNGASFTTSTKVGTAFNVNAQLPPGIGFFVRNGKAASVGPIVPVLTNTFVGSVIVNAGNSITSSIPVGYTLFGSPIPYAGNLSTSGSGGGDPTLNFGANLPGGGSQILIWNLGSQSYSTATKIGSPGTWNLTTPVAVAEGFFGRNKTGPATNYVQTLP